MGILTSRKRSQDFASYVSVFGVALLVTSSIYLYRLQNVWTTEQCDYIFEDVNSLCLDLCIWSSCAGVGLAIGFLDILLFPFLICCVRSWSCVFCGLACGYSSSFIEVEHRQNSVRPIGKHFDVYKTARGAHMGRTSAQKISIDANMIPIERIQISPPTHIWFELCAWILFIVIPSISTAYISAALYKTDAYRTSNESLYHPALALFLVSVLNLMVFCQKFLWSLCRKLCRKVRGRRSEYIHANGNLNFNSNSHSHSNSNSNLSHNQSQTVMDPA